MLYIVSGIDDYQKKKKINEIINETLGKEHAEDAVYINLNDTTLDNIFDEALMVPLFADKKVMVVEECEFLMKSKKKKDGEEESEEEGSNTNYDSFLQHASLDFDFTTIIFTLNGNVLKTKKGMKEALKSIKLFEFAELKEDEKAQFINAQCMANGLQIDEKAKHHLNEILPSDSYTIMKEIEKLSLYGEKVDLKVVDLLVSRPIEDKAFLITEAVLNKNTKRIFTLLQDFEKASVPIQQVMATLATQLRLLYQVAFLRDNGYSKDEIATEIGITPGRVYYSLNSISRYSSSYILRFLNNLSELDLQVKSGKIDAKLGFELLLLKVGAN